MKRVLAFLMAFIFVFSIIPMVLSLALSVNGYTYTVNDGEVEITDYTNNATTVNIPSSIDGYPVTSIGPYAFADRLDNRGTDMSYLILPSTLKRIGEGAFTTNNRITSLTIPENVTEIGSRAFLCWMKLSSINFKGNNLKKIGAWAFRNAHSLSSLTLPNSLETIDEGAFSYCNSLSSVSFPKSVKYIGSNAFLGCTSLSQATILNEEAVLGKNIFDLTATDNNDSTKRAMVISGYESSSAQKFATAEKFTFKNLSSGSGDEPQEDTSGEYFIKLSITVIGTSSNGIKGNYAGFNNKENDTAGISVLYRDVNGTGKVDKEQKFDIKSLLGSTGTYSVTANITGFPRLLYVYLDDDRVGSDAGFKVTKLEVGSSDSDLKTVWTGDMQVKSQFNPYAASVDWDNVIKKDYYGTDSSTFVNNSSGKFDKPYAKTFECALEKSSMNFSPSLFISTNGYTYSAKDQYNVKMSNSLCTLSANSSVSENNKYIQIEQPQTSTGACLVSIKNTAHILTENENKQTITVKASWAGVEKTQSHEDTFEIIDEQYNVEWIDSEGAVLNSAKVYYGDKATFDRIPQKSADAQNHYSNPVWQPVQAQVTDNTSYVASYTAEPHDYNVINSNPASCTEGGEQDMICTKCSYTYHKQLEPLGHNYISEVVAPTCTSEGYTKYICSRCSDTYEDSFVAKTDHEYELVSKTDSTCTEKGVEHYKCKNCDAENIFEFDALGHKYTSVATKPTCTHGGYITFTCTRCSHTYKDGFTDKLEHKFEFIGESQPTCTEEGSEHYKCSACGEDKYIAVNALGHNFNSKRINDNALRNEADENEDASYFYTCSRCRAISDTDYFFVPMARIKGKIDMQGQYKDVKVNLVQDGEIVQTKTLEAGSDGEFVFYSLEDGSYSLSISGEGTTTMEILTVNADSESPVILAESENSDLRLIELSNGDVNADGVVDLSDVSAVLASGAYGNQLAKGRAEDIDNNGIIDALDLSIILLKSNYASSSKTVSVK